MMAMNNSRRDRPSIHDEAGKRPYTSAWRKRKDYLSSLMLYSLLVCFMLPGYIHELNETTNAFFTIARVLGGLVSVILFIINQKRSKCACAITIYIAFIGAITALSLSPTRVIRYIAIYADVFAIVVFTDYLVVKDPRVFLKVMHALLSAGLMINVLSIVIFPDGLLQVANENGVYSPYYFYGYDNRFILQYLPTIAIVFLYEKNEKGKERGGLKTLITLIACSASLIYLKSAASAIALGTVLLLYVLMRGNHRPPKLLIISWAIYCVISVMLITGTVLTPDNELLSQINKESSLLRRQIMWSEAVNMIEDAPFFGVGILATGEMRYLFGFATLHNTLTNIVFWSGIVGFLLYSGIFATMQRELDDSACSYDANFMSVLVIAFLIACFTDCLDLGNVIYMLFIIIGNYGYIRQPYLLSEGKLSQE